MADRSSIIEKIKALMAKTVANGCTEAEMLAALDKVSAMKDAYAVSDEELRVTKEEAVMLHAETADLKDPHNIKWRLRARVVRAACIRCRRRAPDRTVMSASPIQNIELKYWVVRTKAGMLITWFEGTPKRATRGLRAMERAFAEEMVLQQITKAEYAAIVAAPENKVFARLIVDSSGAVRVSRMQ